MTSREQLDLCVARATILMLSWSGFSAERELRHEMMRLLKDVEREEDEKLYRHPHVNDPNPENHQ